MKDITKQDLKIILDYVLEATEQKINILDYKINDKNIVDYITSDLLEEF